MQQQNKYIMKTRFTYLDSEAGAQKETFNTLSEITAHIESFNYTQDSCGTVFQDGEAIIEYQSTENGIVWIPAEQI